MKDTILFKNISKRLLIFILIFSLVFNYTNFYAANAYAVGSNDYTIPQCQDIKDEDFKFELKQSVESSFAKEINKSNIQPIVEQKWQDLKLNGVIDYEIDDAVITVKNQTGYWGRFTSRWNSEQAKRLADKIINLAFNDSSAVSAKLQELSKEVAKELSPKVELVKVPIMRQLSQFYQVTQVIAGQHWGKMWEKTRCLLGGLHL